MRTSILLLLWLTLVSCDLFAQCDNCDSILRTRGSRLLTDEEIRANPGLLIMANSVDCKRLIEEANRIRKPIRFRGKWGYLTLRYGFDYGRLRASGMFIDGFKFDRSQHQYLSAGFDLDAPELSGFIVRAEMSFRPQAFNGINPEAPGKALRRWQINGNTMSEEITLGYKSMRGAFRWFVTAGMGGYQLRIQHNTQIDYTNGLPQQSENDVKVREANGYTSLSAGIIYRHRIELRIKRTGTQWSCNPANYKMNVRDNIFTVGYRI